MPRSGLRLLRRLLRRRDDFDQPLCGGGGLEGGGDDGARGLLFAPPPSLVGAFGVTDLCSGVLSLIKLSFGLNRVTPMALMKRAGATRRPLPSLLPLGMLDSFPLGRARMLIGIALRHELTRPRAAVRGLRRHFLVGHSPISFFKMGGSRPPVKRSLTLRPYKAVLLRRLLTSDGAQFPHRDRNLYEEFGEVRSSPGLLISS